MNFDGFPIRAKAQESNDHKRDQNQQPDHHARYKWPIEQQAQDRQKRPGANDA